LFWVLAIAISAAIGLGLPATDFHTARGTEGIVLRSVRCALPFFLIAFTASSWATLWPGRFTRWLLANRRYFGLAFAFGMAWHLSFVSYYLTRFHIHFSTPALAADFIGLTFLVALTLTSFRPVARHLSSVNWRRLHKLGVYVIWLLAVYIYQGGARHERDPQDIAALTVLLSCWLLRLAAAAKDWQTRRGRAAPLRTGSAY
jgi:DMSO/TMAO reductase YedYZ heme-binding membrane subunit